MKVIFASTHEQEEIIQELIEQIYSEVFPRFFNNEEIQYFHELQVLHTTTRHFEYFGTLSEAYQVITSLQTIISILENKKNKRVSSYYEEIFNKNVDTLQYFGLFFPFSIQQFSSKKVDIEELSMFTKAANELLV
ncbi:hypothetical protein J2S13_001111 [Oikeobacillus pervagus]|uniref:YhcU family protein n=1 Tax=Oikeobacillus pervagus TaxID=1325931 RepID=A0AAJ1SXT2_9BACI|nr:DUF5365 family protein [Oikeobacillus pervagus]MDQ0214714.1 hypothetical protein [Oikeobacillus pervagus]